MKYVRVFDKQYEVVNAAREIAYDYREDITHCTQNGSKVCFNLKNGDQLYLMTKVSFEIWSEYKDYKYLMANEYECTKDYAKIIRKGGKVNAL